MAGKRPPNSKGRYAEGEFKPKNPDKYIGIYPIYARSSWEFVFMNVCDTHPDITKWASESIKIPYFNTFTRKQTIYVPDFLVQYEDSKGKIHVEVIEIKPLNQTIIEKARSNNNKIQVAINISKWTAARKWCKKHGMTFRIMTEADLFSQIGSRRKRKR